MPPKEDNLRREDKKAVPIASSLRRFYCTTTMSFLISDKLLETYSYQISLVEAGLHPCLLFCNKFFDWKNWTSVSKVSTVLHLKSSPTFVSPTLQMWGYIVRQRILLRLMAPNTEQCYLEHCVTCIDPRDLDIALTVQSFLIQGRIACES